MMDNIGSLKFQNSALAAALLPVLHDSQTVRCHTVDTPVHPAGIVAYCHRKPSKVGSYHLYYMVPLALQSQCLALAGVRSLRGWHIWKIKIYISICHPILKWMFTRIPFSQ